MKKTIVSPNRAATSSKHKTSFSAWKTYFEPIVLPILVASIPTLYHYGNNVEQLTLSSLFQMLVFNIVLGIVIYFALMLFHRFDGIKAATAAFLFLIFFNAYGLLYRYLVHADVIRVRHYTFLPLILMLAIYAILLMTKLDASILVNVWKNLVLLVGILVLFNLIHVVAAEVKRWKNNVSTAASDVQETVQLSQDSPDIYYIIFDEFEGFQGMRDYWHYDGVDSFVDFLEGKGFFVAEASHASSQETLDQMATRLNYQEYVLGEVTFQTYFNDIADNRVMRYLKSKGYTTVAFDEKRMGFPAAKSIQADYVYEYGSLSIPQGVVGPYGIYLDEFGALVLDNTILYAISQKYENNNQTVSQHKNMVYFTVDHIDSKEFPSPKFVHIHLLLPHQPFVFDEDGNIMASDHYYNWNYYIDSYKYSIKVAETLINKILLTSDPQNPPVIILQSDHGARNKQGHRADDVILQDYPEELATLIMFALYLPGYDYSSLPQDIKPINTFPIVFNYLFDDDIPLRK